MPSADAAASSTARRTASSARYPTVSMVVFTSPDAMVKSVSPSMDVWTGRIERASPS